MKCHFSEGFNFFINSYVLGLPPVNKDFYREEPEIASWSFVEVERFRFEFAWFVIHSCVDIICENKFCVFGRVHN